MTEMPPYLAVKDEEKIISQGDNEISSYADDWDLPLSYDKPWHLEPIKGAERIEHSWRIKEKYKTHCVALVLCLNVSVDPPDVVKTQPCARLECWIDPLSMSSTKALESIGQALQAQYERWQPRARYKQSMDPTSDEVKKLCCSLRRNAKDERVLFHYNGHGVPKPTNQGEIWVFNRSYTQYIPLSMYDLQTWMGAPSLYVYDCSNAGVIIDNFNLFADQHEREAANAKPTEGGGGPVSYKNCIQLAACAAGQTLPMSPELPADVFTACLTTPVKMAIHWFVLRMRVRRAPPDVDELVDKIPGQVADRRTMLGELNWIFTAITDTIAWSSLPADLFQQLFRADLLTASLCRNFLLADRIMRCYNCTPVSQPALPSLASHPLWRSWDAALDAALSQLPDMLRPPYVPYKHSSFFKDQLTAFQVWLDLGNYVESRPPPDQLPMVLQVLLSTLHRVRALRILCSFLAQGPWAVRQVLAVGIFPYMLKLLQASAPDLRASMVYIWAKIIAVDPSCQVDLVNARGHKYFIFVLQDCTVDLEHRTLAAYVLAGIVDNYRTGQEMALQSGMVSTCLEQLDEGGGGEEGDGRLQQWSCVALGRLWRGYDAARWAGVRDLAHEKLYALLSHSHAPTRAACVFALGCLVGTSGSWPRSEHAHALDQQVAVHLAGRANRDASLIVRAEILAALQWLVLIFEQHFIAVYIQERMRRSERASGVAGGASVEAGQDVLAVGGRDHRRHAALTLPTIGFGSVYMKLWNMLTCMSKEPHAQISQMAKDIINYISNQLDSVSRETEAVRAGGSSSLPPSPNTRPSALALAALPPLNTLPHTGHRRGRSGLPTTISEDSMANRERDHTSSNSSSQFNKKPIVRTEFVQWAWSMEGGREGGEGAAEDCESRAYHERQWRRSRNRSLCRQARGVRHTRVSRLESQAFHSRCPLPPAVVMFHPYEQHLVIASKDNFSVWDWGTAAKLTAGTWRRAWGRISSLAYVHAHQHGLIAVASHCGNLALYRPGGGSSGGCGSGGVEPALVTAWRALDVRPAPDYRPPAAQPLYSGGGVSGAYSPPPPPVLMSWSETRRSLALCGPAAVLRLWDAHRELLQADIPTGSEAAATSLWRGASTVVGSEDCHQLVVGFADGSVRSWDERVGLAPIACRQHHVAPVLCAALRPGGHAMLTGCMNGEIRLYDTRKGSTELELVRAPGPLAAIDVHPLCSLIACGSVNQCISIYDLKGSLLNTIKFHEGFMGARIGPISCLTFHPLRCAMGVGAKDSTVSVYVADSRR